MLSPVPLSLTPLSFISLPGKPLQALPVPPPQRVPLPREHSWAESRGTVTAERQPTVGHSQDLAPQPGHVLLYTTGAKSPHSSCFDPHSVSYTEGPAAGAKLIWLSHLPAEQKANKKLKSLKNTVKLKYKAKRFSYALSL